MLDFLRRHNKTFFLVVTAVIIISFTFWGGYTNPGGEPGMPDDVAFTIHGREHDYASYNRLRRLYVIAERLGLSVLDGRAGFAEAVTGFAPRFRAEEEVPRDFVFNLLLLRHELQRGGIRASDAEVKQRLRALPVFQTNGDVDRAKLEGFENFLGSYGMAVADVHELVRDWLGMEKLIGVVAGNSVASAHLGDQFYAATYQTIKAASIPFAIEPYKKAAAVTEDEIKKSYDQKKEQFKTPEKRAAVRVFFESPQGLDKIPLEERIKKNAEFSRRVEAFSTESFAQGAKFEELAKKFGVEVKRVPAFAIDEQPEALKEASELIFEIFRADPKTHPVSDPIKAEKGYHFFRVTEIQAPRQQSLDEARAKIRETLVGQKAQEAMMKAANDARQRIADAMKAGRKFEDAAREAKVQPQDLPEFTPAEPPKDLSNGQQIAMEAGQTAAGNFASRPLTVESGVLLLFVKSKELRKREDSAGLRQRVTQSLGTLMRRDVFRAWFDRRRDEAAVKSNLPDRM